MTIWKNSPSRYNCMQYIVYGWIIVNLMKMNLSTGILHQFTHVKINLNIKLWIICNVSARAWWLTRSHSFWKITYTVFHLITSPALITAPLTFYFIVTYYRPLDDLFPDFLLYFHLLSPTWRSFDTFGTNLRKRPGRLLGRIRYIYIRKGFCKLTWTVTRSYLSI